MKARAGRRSVCDMFSWANAGKLLVDQLVALRTRGEGAQGAYELTKAQRVELERTKTIATHDNLACSPDHLYDVLLKAEGS